MRLLLDRVPGQGRQNLRQLKGEFPLQRLVSVSVCNLLETC